MKRKIFAMQMKAYAPGKQTGNGVSILWHQKDQLLLFKNNINPELDHQYLTYVCSVLRYNLLLSGTFIINQTLDKP